jgi:hypothetical protein
MEFPSDDAIGTTFLFFLLHCRRRSFASGPVSGNCLFPVIGQLTAQPKCFERPQVNPENAVDFHDRHKRREPAHSLARGKMLCMFDGLQFGGDSTAGQFSLYESS